MKEYKMDIKIIDILKVITLILLIVIVLLIKYIMYILNIEKQMSEFVFGMIIFISISMYLVYNLLIVPLWFNRKNYFVSEDGITLNTGVFIKSSQYIKISSIQSVLLYYIPVLSEKGFNFIVFNSSIGKITFIFISQNDADEILAFANKNIGVK